ncbi:protein gp37 [Bradyrhizobium elkanii]
MAETHIEWTDATWNPVAGCSIVTAGCTNCYAMQMAKRLEAMGVEKYEGLTRRSGKRTVWNGVVREDRAALDIPYGWKKPKKIFVNSMSDLFHEQVTDQFILDVWKVMRATPQHNYQILTKSARGAWLNLSPIGWTRFSRTSGLGPVLRTRKCAIVPTIFAPYRPQSASFHSNP